jgi:dGTPase
VRPSNRIQDSRNEFESDYGRIIFSPAIRRMHDKTQVFPLTTNDNIHSRLTHSMEAMAIGHSLGVTLCKEKKFVGKISYDNIDLERTIPILLQNAALVHDIGNPPFGHFGETIFQTYFKKLFDKPTYELSLAEQKDFTCFDGNAQGFRVLTKLQYLNDLYGLNLTYATLGSFLKYPNAGEINSKLKAQNKRGVFQPEKDYLDKIVNACGLKNSEGAIIRHPLAYLVEAADSICYLVMDIEDGFNKNWYQYEDVEDILKDNIDSGFWEKNKGNENSVDKFVKLRIYLIAKLRDLAVDNFVRNLDDIQKGMYNQELILDDEKGLAKALMMFCKEQIFPKREIQLLELTGHSVINGLLDYFINFIFDENKQYRERAKGLISKSIITVAYLENGLSKDRDISCLTDYSKLRLIVDYVSGMTDQFALSQYQKLSGQKL